MKTFLWTIALCGVALLMACHPNMSRNPVLTVDGGQLTGIPTDDGKVIVYKGIPYAAPPVGALRWREPQPPIPWQGVKCADTFGPAAMQSDQEPGSFYQREFFWMGDPQRSEDCLYLNVWTPAAGQPEARLPVAVWIHGGAYIQGYGHEIEFDGEAFARRGVVLVTLNYRLGVAGFLAHPLLSAENPHGVSGNYGLLDQRAALDWVHRNIDRFGGDPANLTLFGQSAGAGSVQALLASPLCQGRATKAILQSGGGLRGLGSRQNGLAEAEASGRALMEFAGLTTLEAMRACPAEQLCALPEAFAAAGRGAVQLAPCVDGYFLPATFSDAARAGRLPDLPYMIGSTAGDSPEWQTSPADFSLLLESQGRRPAYVYRFTRPLPGDRAGAFHSAELWYLFGTLDRSWRPFTAADRDLSRRIIGYWTNFMRTDDPNGPDLAPWAPCTHEHSEAFELDISVQ